MEVDVILDHLVDEEETVIVALQVVDRHVMTVLIERTSQFWHVESLHELVTGTNVNVAWW